MTMLSISGVIEAPLNSEAQVAASLEKLGAALSERFDRVRIANGAVEASASNLMALIYGGRRTHPMLPFDAAILEPMDGAPHRLKFTLSIKMQVITYPSFGLLAGVILSIDAGWSGFAAGVGFGAAAFLLNHLITSGRAREWLSAEWAEASDRDRS